MSKNNKKNVKKSQGFTVVRTVNFVFTMVILNSKFDSKMKIFDGVHYWFQNDKIWLKMKIFDRVTPIQNDKIWLKMKIFHKVTPIRNDHFWLKMQIFHRVPPIRNVKIWLKMHVFWPWNQYLLTLQTQTMRAVLPSVVERKG